MSWIKVLGVVAAMGSGTGLANQRISFEFREPNSGEIAIQAIEEISRDGDSIVKKTSYFDTKGKMLLKESYRSTATGGQLESFSSEDFQSGEQVEMKATDDRSKVEIRHKNSTTDSWRRSDVDNGPFVVHGKVLPELILAHWQDLTTGKNIEIELLVPTRLETIGFRLLHDSSASRQTNHEVFVAEASNWLIRMLAPKIKFDFSRDGERRLLTFTGPSPVEIGGEKHKTLQATFGEIISSPH